MGDDQMAADPAASPGAAKLRAAFADIAEMLRSDGFIADWSVASEGEVSFVVGAGDAACAECLVPKPVLGAMLSSALEGSGYRLVDVRLPEDRLRSRPGSVT
jgi:hypothetical protein